MPNFTCVKNGPKLCFTRLTDGRKAIYDLTDASCYNYRGKQVKDLRSYFVNSYFSDIEWKDPAYANFVRCVMRSNSRLTNVGSMLDQLYRFKDNEGYILLGLPAFKKVNKPISALPKSVRKYLISRFAQDNLDLYRGYFDFHYWVNFLSDEGTEKLRFIELLNSLDVNEELRDLSIDQLKIIFNMTKDYNMDMKHLIWNINQYIQREGMRLYEVLRNLRDYNRMSKAMSEKWQKYPKYLLSTHQIVVRNYNAFREHYEEEAFKAMVDENLAHTGVSFSILVPEHSQDIKDEGAQQHHCVASYVRSVISGDCQIVFLRSNKKLEKPLITMEIRDNVITQAKGAYNRPASEEELKFIRTYANQHNLTIGKYL